MTKWRVELKHVIESEAEDVDSLLEKMEDDIFSMSPEELLGGFHITNLDTGEVVPTDVLAQLANIPELNKNSN